MPRHWGWWTSSAIWMTPSRRPPISPTSKSWQVTPSHRKSRPGTSSCASCLTAAPRRWLPHLQSWLPAGLGKALLEMNRTLDYLADPLPAIPRAPTPSARSVSPDAGDAIKTADRRFYKSNKRKPCQVSKPDACQRCNSASTRVSRAVHWGRGPASWVLLVCRASARGTSPA